MNDILIKNGLIIDGSGNTGYVSSVAIKDGKIVEIGDKICDDATTVIDANGLVVCPGFIDNHSHSDLTLLLDNSGYNMLEQGITTEVTGMCGLGLAPASPSLFKYISMKPYGKEKTALIASLTSYKRFYSVVEEMGTATNIAFTVQQGTIRIAVMGFENRRATASEMAKMKDIVREGMENGAIGLTTGLIYPPGIYTSENEIVQLCKVVAEYGGCYYTHIRNESNNVIEAVKEAIRIGEKAGIAVVISHHKIASKDTWGASRDTLRLIDEANARGLRVSADMYPYNAGCSYLKAVLPPTYASLGNEVIVEKLKDVAVKQQIKKIILNDNKTFENFIQNCGFENIRFIMSGDSQEDGKTIAQYAQENNIDCFEAVFQLLIKSKCNACGIFYMMCDKDIERIMAHPNVMFGTDGMVVAKGFSSVPRAYGTFPRILGRYVREKKVLTIEEAIRKMTSLPAKKAKLYKKGLLDIGYDADVVIFNADTIIDNSEISNITAKNEGIAYVIVNGKIAVKDNVITGVKAGKTLRRK
ncbi:D-aminoacylase [Clostridium sp. 'deep sea']|uniref:N-acyl-D-amino-acid deacylase family protein n=1 Tax=Clostridium sp. 'deep sea' TaxID=2779445 RepID=UPI0018964FF2|nr:D-aminoacylase [Clostridium sp. 'deep sea']QOR35214.1 D-aminoacylase [Clostridium sp. 'deep sea']